MKKCIDPARQVRVHASCDATVATRISDGDSDTAAVETELLRERARAGMAVIAADNFGSDFIMQFEMRRRLDPQDRRGFQQGRHFARLHVATKDFPESPFRFGRRTRERSSSLNLFER